MRRSEEDRLVGEPQPWVQREVTRQSTTSVLVNRELSD